MRLPRIVSALTTLAIAEPSMVMRATIEGWHPVNVANARMHWATKHRATKAEKGLAFWAAREAGWRPVKGKARLAITLVFPKGPLPDQDNCVARCKALIDGIKHIYIRDDSPEWLDLVVMARVEPGRKATELELSASSDNEGSPE